MTPGEPSLDAPSWQPVREERNAPLGILLVLVLALVGWLAWESQRPPMAVELPAPQPVSETPAVVPQAEIKEVKANAAPVKAAEEPAPQEPPPEIRKAELVTPPVPVVAPKRPQGTRASVDNPDALIRSLFSAKSMEARAELIAHPEDNRADMEGFFDRNPVALKALQPAGADLLSIPGQEASPLFQVVTDKNPKGALLRLVPTAEGLRVDWPLFAETHERKLAGYLAEKKDQPAWFHVILRRSHGLELPEAERAQHLCLDVQASADDSVRCLAVVPKDTPLGRFFDREAAWGNVYVSRLLLQRQRGADELLGVIVLDCEGAAKGALSSVGSSGR